MDSIEKRPHTRVFAATALTIAVALLGLFMPIPRGPAFSAASDLAHAPLFVGLTIGALWLVQSLRPIESWGHRFVLRALAVGVGMGLCGLATEYAQRFFPRNSSFEDAITNALAIAAATLVYLACARWDHCRDARVLHLGMIAVAGLLIAAAVWTPVYRLWGIYGLRRQFPMLASFESSYELGHWYPWHCSCALTTRGATDRKHALEITAEAVPHSGPALRVLVPDWREIRTFEMDVLLDDSYPRESLQMEVKIWDRHRRGNFRDTYRSYWTLRPGEPQHIQITRDQIIHGPDEREIDLSRIQYVSVMLLNPVTTTKLNIDAVHLKL